VRHRHIARIAALGVAVALAAAGCSSSSDSGSSGSSKCDLKLAFFGALTGSSANLGINERNGAKLAVKQYNDKNADCKVTLQEFDSEGDPAKAPGLARQVVKDPKIVGLVGPAFSGESEAADPIFNQAGLPIITASATRPTLATSGWKIFHRALGNDNSQGPGAGLYIKNVLKAQKAFVVDDQSAYGAGLADQVKKTLGNIVVGSDKVGADGKQTDFSATVTKIKTSGATAVFYGGYYQNAGLIRKQLTAAGVKATMVAGDGVNDPGFIENAGKAAAEGTILTCPCAPATTAKGTFVKDYQTEFKVAPGTYSDVAFDAANIMLNGIKSGVSTPAKMLDYINKANYTGISNTYKFTSTGELDPSLVVVWAFKVINGDIKPDQKTPTS
jgi:branched-chain amino acid transport system substrate-binding protein